MSWGTKIKKIKTQQAFRKPVYITHSVVLLVWNTWKEVPHHLREKWKWEPQRRSTSHSQKAPAQKDRGEQFGESGHMGTCGWVSLPHTWNHHIVSPLQSSINKEGFKQRLRRVNEGTAWRKEKPSSISGQM